MEIVGKNYVRGALPQRAADGHKGTFGKLLIVGGSVGFTGAPYLAALGAEHAGCGLVYLGVPQEIWAVEAVKCAGAMPFPLDVSDRQAALKLLRERADCTVLAVGPGLGRSEGAAELVHALLRGAAAPVVLDADGLNALSTDLDPLRARAADGRVTVLTPHLGEFARLLGAAGDGLTAENRAEFAAVFAKSHGCVLLSKGHPTYVAAPDGTVYEIAAGSNALAKGGSGDVLTGVIAALIAQGAKPVEAACCGAWLHGRAGELLEAKRTAYCVTPEDVAREGLALAFEEGIQK